MKEWLNSLPWNKVPKLKLELTQSKEIAEFNAKKNTSLANEMFKREVLLGRREGEIEDLKMTIIDAVELLQNEKSKNEKLQKIIEQKELLEKIAKEVSDKL